MLTVAADGGGDLLEPLQLEADGPVVPDLVGEAERAEEGRVHGGGAGDGHVGAFLEVGRRRLGRREERQPELGACSVVCGSGGPPYISIHPPRTHNSPTGQWARLPRRDPARAEFN